MPEELEKKQIKILTVDDEFALRQSLVAYLEDSDFDICEAENGQQGLEVFREEKPDLVLTDIQMPVMSGLELLENIAKESPDTPVVVVSGAGGMNDVIKALQLGAWDYITKPVSDLEVLEHAIKICLERAQLIKDNKLYKAKIEHNLRTLQEDQEAGKNVQMRLLPEKEIKINNYIMSHSVTPSLYLSGDFIDYFAIDEDKTCVYLADVSGHGSSSAFITILLKNLITKILSRYEVSKDTTILEPDKLMAEISNEIYNAKLGKYLTMAYIVIDNNTHEAVYGIGGHYPNPILFDKNKEIKFLPGEGYPVGIINNAKYKTEKIKLEQGDQLLTFSDGVMEIFMHGKPMEEQDKGLLSLIKEVDAKIPDILKKLGIVTGDDTERPDDVTILGIRRE